jgi:hypothetical protein
MFLFEEMNVGKVADIKLFWQRTATPIDRIMKQRVDLVVDGVQYMIAEFGPEIQDFQITVRASQSVTYTITTTDKEGLEAVSASYSFTLGDLVAPLPATGLGHAVLAIRDEDLPE